MLEWRRWLVVEASLVVLLYISPEKHKQTQRADLGPETAIPQTLTYKHSPVTPLLLINTVIWGKSLKTL